MSTNGESPAPDAAGDSRDPSGFLSEIIGAPVTVKLNSGIVYKGMCKLSVRRLPLMSSGDLQSVDGYMNIALERCKEVAEGRVIRSWGDAFVRGNNGTLLIACVFLCHY
jgi:U6 snRNA-associated Sm-like protein LSm6